MLLVALRRHASKGAQPGFPTPGVRGLGVSGWGVGVESRGLGFRAGLRV